MKISGDLSLPSYNPDSCFAIYQTNLMTFNKEIKTRIDLNVPCSLFP